MITVRQLIDRKKEKKAGETLFELPVLMSMNVIVNKKEKEE